MKRALSAPIALFGGLTFLTVVVFADLNGRWTGTITTPDGNQLQVVYNFKVSGDTLTGTAESPQGSFTIDNGKVTGDNFSFKVTVEGNDYPHTGTVYKDSCGLDIDFGDQKIHTTLTRAAEGQIEKFYRSNQSSE